MYIVSMDRRRIFGYALMLSAGIWIGYMMLDEGRIKAGTAAFASLIAAVCLLQYQLGAEYHLSYGQLHRLLVTMMAGFICFAAQYYQLRTDGQTLASDQQSEICGTVLQGRVRAEKTEYVVQTDLPSGSKRVLCTVYIKDCSYQWPDQWKEGSQSDDKGDNISDNTEEENAAIFPEVPDGSKVRITGTLRIPSAQRNPGCFNYAQYLKSRGISYTITAGSIDMIGQGAGPRNHFIRELQRLKERFLLLFKNDKDVLAFLMGSVFGDRSLIEEDTYEEFTGNGTAHILAVSGLHVGFLITLLAMLTGNRKHWRISVLIFGILLMYGALTGWSASSERAVIIAGLGMGAMYVQRPFDLTSAVAASVLIMLPFRPYLLFQSGFIMSFAAVLGMAFMTEPISHFIGKKAAPLIALQLATVPYSIYSFNRFNPVTILINIPVVFVASALIPAAVAAFAAESVFCAVPSPAVSVISAMTEALIRLNRMLYMDGTFSFEALSASPFMLLMIYTILILVSSELFRVMVIRRDRSSIVRMCMILLLPIAVFGAVMRNPFSDDEIVFIDVSQGDAVHIRTDAYNVLIDGGGSRDYSVGKRVLEPYFLKNHTAKLDLVLCTHLHMDHYKGVQELAEEFPIGNFAVPSIYRLTDSAPDAAQYVSVGDRIRLADDVFITVLWPLAPKPEAAIPDEENENLMNGVYRIDYRNVRVLITGDLLEEGEADMIQYYCGTDALKCDVLKVAHHGSRSSSSDAFLDAADPEAAVIQVGKNNRYGHPSPETLKKFAERKIPVYRTDQNGAVGIDIEDGELRFDTMIKSEEQELSK